MCWGQSTAGFRALPPCSILLHTSTHLWEQRLGQTPLPGTRTGFLPQQIEAVNIDNLLFQGFFNALRYLGTIKRTHHY